MKYAIAFVGALAMGFLGARCGDWFARREATKREQRELQRAAQKWGRP